MSDFLLDSAYARTLIRGLGLPLPIPEPLERAAGAWEERPLEGRSVIVCSPRGMLLEPIIAALRAAGAAAIVAPDVTETIHGIVFDATGVDRIADLGEVYELFHRTIDRLERPGRAVVVCRPAESATDAEAAASRRALEGFVRSLAKEIGRRGATANLVSVESGAEERLEAVLRFVLSKRSAFVSAQPISVTASVLATGRSSWVRALDGKVALVTGAARGIGAATAARLAAEGARVVCVDRPADAAPLGEVARTIGGDVLLADVSDPAAPQAIADRLRARQGGVDIVVHNAGITRDKTLGRMERKSWDEVLDINLGAVLRISAALEPLLHDGGRIICLSSIAGIAGNVGQTNYAASKAGLIGFVRRQSGVLASRGITVNAVAPGFIETRLTEAVPFFVREIGRRLSALGQGGLPQDVAEVIAFLAAPSTVGITGSVLRVCGGAYLGA
jgi:3-oxoacyl-[acyl-carrier protein] reductase